MIECDDEHVVTVQTSETGSHQPGSNSKNTNTDQLIVLTPRIIRLSPRREGRIHPDSLDERRWVG